LPTPRGWQFSKRCLALTVGEVVERRVLIKRLNHLGCLRDCGLVTSEQRGKIRALRVGDSAWPPPGLAEELLADVAEGVYECTRYSPPRKR
jgi:DNA-binding transcriptional ArsR family regulator